MQNMSSGFDELICAVVITTSPWCHNLHKKVVPFLTKKSKHLHRIQHILISFGIKIQLEQTYLTLWCKFIQGRYFRINLSTKVYFKRTILNFWTKFAQKGYFWSKTEKGNIAIELCIFVLVSIWNF